MTKRGRGRPRKENKIKKPIVSGQLEQEELAAVEVIQTARGRSQSYVVRLAITRLLADEAAGVIDWTKGAGVEHETLAKVLARQVDSVLDEDTPIKTFHGSEEAARATTDPL